MSVSSQELCSPPRSENKLDEIRKWSSAMTAEERDFYWVPIYYVWPKNAVRLRNLLKSSRRKLIAVIGAQGVGKTSTMHALHYDALAPNYTAILLEAQRRRNTEVEAKEEESKNVAKSNEVVAFNWREMKNFLNGLGPLPASIALFSSFNEAYVTALNSLLTFKPASLRYGQKLTVEATELHLGKVRVRQARWTAISTVLESASTILIDMPDYSRTDRRLMVNDLEAIQSLWRNLLDSFSNVNLVIFLQKEMFHDHFLFGKMEVITLEPFKSSELVEGYKKIHDGTFPFTEESLLLLARMSRGIFRRFVKYINMALENRENATNITEDDVISSVSEEQLLSDNEQELAAIFPKSDQSRLQARKVLQFIETSSANQKELAESVGISEYALSRILDKLELHHKIRREKKGLENIIRLESY